jgi:hypothetical protein
VGQQLLVCRGFLTLFSQRWRCFDDLVSPESRSKYEAEGTQREFPLDPGDESYLDVIRTAYRCGELSRHEWLERVRRHGEALPRASEQEVLAEIAELEAEGVLNVVDGDWRREAAVQLSLFDHGNDDRGGGA